MKLVRQTVLLQRVSGCGSCERKDASSPDTKVKEASVVANPNFSRFSRYCEANISRICSPPYRLTRRMIKTITFEIPLSRHEIVRVKNSNANPRKSCSRRFSRDAAFQLQSPVLWPDRKLKLGRASDRTERWKKMVLRPIESYLEISKAISNQRALFFSVIVPRLWKDEPIFSIIIVTVVQSR